MTAPSTATDKASWLEAMDRMGEEVGYFQSLAPRHWAFFCDESTTLLVTFDTLRDARGRAGQMPLGHDLAQARGWSHLCLIADGPTWFRDAAVHSFFDRLVEDAFFEDFDRVVFHGSGMGGYAACAFSVTAPEATVLALSARATLDPARAGWDRRNMGQRRLDFRSRYGFAPDMVEGTGQVFLAFDPLVSADAAHAAMFDRPNVTPLRAWHAGADPAILADACLGTMLDLAVEGELSPATFARLWRARQENGAYLRHLLAQTQHRAGLAQKVFDAIRTM